MENSIPGHRRSSFRRGSLGDRSSRGSVENGSASNLLSLYATNSGVQNSESIHKTCVQVLLNNSWYLIFVTIVTIYALFGDDVRLAATNKSSDSVFFSLATVCFAVFFVEIVLASYAQDQYFLRFFFWLDLLATVSLLADIGWVWDSITGTNQSFGKSTTQTTQIARAGRASRAGTRAGRIIRIIRVIRLIRIVKLYKISQNGKKILNSEKKMGLVRGVQNFRGEELGPFIANEPHQQYDFSEEDYSQSFQSIQSESMSQVQPDKLDLDILPKDQEFSIPEESKIGKKFSDLTTKRVIVLVLSVLFVLPFFSTALYLDDSITYNYGLRVISSLVSSEDFELAWNSYINENKDLDTPLVYLELGNGTQWSQNPSFDSLRDTELKIYSIETNQTSVLAVFDFQSQSQLDAILSISETIFICLILIVSSIYLTKDAQELVIEPIENIVDKVRKISENPLKAAQEEERKKVSIQMASFDKKQSVLKTGKESLETITLQQTISKIGALLALGFGEAGSEIISLNMQQVGGEVDPMIPGKKTYCIFGFCDIRNFTQATEVLQQNILTFVNEIAYIVHSNVDAFSGFTNKNIGDAFLLVWKFPEKLLNRTEDTKKIELVKDRMTSQIADMATISFIKIIVEINSNEKIVKYREHPGLLKAISGFSVNMGFGLHQGWAIEGAIGSEFKVDASYLSPNVNMASRLEAATRQFGVHILISECMWEICSKHIQTQFRKVDRVTLKGSQMPLDLYTCDLDLNCLKCYAEDEELENPEFVKLAKKVARDKLMEQVSSGEISAWSLFENDSQITLARSKVPKQFYKAYAFALNEYLQGNWVEARAGFIRAQEIKGIQDGPCNTLLRFIEDYELRPPSNWKGFRVLTDK